MFWDLESDCSLICNFENLIFETQESDKQHQEDLVRKFEKFFQESHEALRRILYKNLCLEEFERNRNELKLLNFQVQKLQLFKLPNFGIQSVVIGV